jgi:hypothetical protein
MGALTRMPVIMQSSNLLVMTFPMFHVERGDVLPTTWTQIHEPPCAFHPAYARSDYLGGRSLRNLYKHLI